MANIKYFADLADGSILSFAKVDYRSSKDIRGFADGSWHKVTRSVEYRSFPSRHACDARCLNATGRIMRCECACMGKNHGRGSFACEVAA